MNVRDFSYKSAQAISYDPKPLPLDTPGHPGQLPECPDCTIVLLKTGSPLLITNPHVIQLLRNLE
ncbi:hypothetical protein [Myroides pelagicus]|uniref:Uncharacterized protein n=1 Tax=Myroides pelagicus TaxID=270914 RepID=A0A7K1GNE9_9FLAO|nr:hypothetical protein [Myroides pelagicus]MEC4114165.1 hypothetical protein [Myroides pelagicus]MTH29724.1 hypothetical protein [Myroides pelagicus]